MEQLTKQQLVLLALLVSFVTSLATGIFTVSLMEQAPTSVVQTIHQVVEKIATPQTAAVVTASSTEDKIVSAIANVSQSIVKLRSTGTQTIIGLGLIVSKEGVIMADKSTLEKLSGFEAVFPNGWISPVSIIQAQSRGDVVFLAPSEITNKFNPIDFGTTARMGQTVLTLSGSNILSVSQGIVSKLQTDAINPDGSQPALIDTGISSSATMSGSPLFNVDGKVIGMQTKTTADLSDMAAFYPVMQLRDSVPMVK